MVELKTDHAIFVDGLCSGREKFSQCEAGVKFIDGAVKSDALHDFSMNISFWLNDETRSGLN